MLEAPSGYPVQSPHVAIANKAAESHQGDVTTIEALELRLESRIGVVGEYSETTEFVS